MDEATRLIFWNVDHYYIFYLLALASTAVFALGVFQRIKTYFQGREGGKNRSIFRALKYLLKEWLGQRKITEDIYAGLMHSLILGGFVVLFVGTLIIAAVYDFGLNFLRGNFYLIFSLLLDIAGFAFLLGLLMVGLRRIILKPKRIEYSLEHIGIFALLFGIGLSGFIVEGLRIAADKPQWAVWSPVGYVLAEIFRYFSVSAIYWHFAFWWVHSILALLFIALIPYSKLWHIIISPANIILRANDKLFQPELVEVEQFMETGVIGANKISEFTKVQLVGLDACVGCGRCEEECPAFITGRLLSPRSVVLKLQERLFSLRKQHRVQSLTTNVEEIFSCASCLACAQACPVSVRQPEIINEMRRSLVAGANIPSDANFCLTKLLNSRNPFGIFKEERVVWADGIDREIKFLQRGETAEFIYWIGCVAAFDLRAQNIARSVVKIMQHAGISFAVLGNKEMCCGDPARQLGEEFLFQELARKNIELLQASGASKILTHCAHCFNVLKSEYPDLGGKFDVVHHTEFIDELISQRKIKLDLGNPESITYHDPCYLGRANGIYQAPRRIISSVANLVEMSACREKSFCCGGGGGGMFVDLKIGERFSKIRLSQAAEAKASVLITACPLCLRMLDEGGGVGVTVKDIAEMLAEMLV